MRASWTVLGLVGLLGCGNYITKDEFYDSWDPDGDGWGADVDCDNDDASIFPWAADMRGDGCDADCGTAVDSDGDDFPDGADCEPYDPGANPCAIDTAGDGFDADCDGQDIESNFSCPGYDPGFPADSQTALEATCGFPAVPVATE